MLSVRLTSLVSPFLARAFGTLPADVPRKPLASVLRTTAFRVALANACAFAVATVALSALFFVFARERVLAQIDSDISGERQTLLATLEDSGVPGLVAALDRRTEGPHRTEAYYQLLGPDGRRLAGNLPHVDTMPGWSWVAVPRDPMAGLDDGLVRAWTEHLPNSGSLLVGRNPRRLDELEDTVRAGLLWSELGTLLFGFMSGYFVSRRVLGGVVTVAEAAGRIGAGDLAHRIPSVGGGPEIAAIRTAVNLMLDRIEKLTDSLRQVTDDIAHDLRTPLGRLRQDLDRSTSSARTTEDFQLAVDRALAETDAIIGTFNALLRIAQVEAQDRRNGFAEVDLSGLLLRLADVYGPTAEDTGHAMPFAVEPGIHVSGDADLLGQMTANLIENALCHTPPGSTIAVTLTAPPCGPSLVVADDGPGIPMADRGRVLGRFVRLDASRATFGTGLGLALVKAVADLHRIALELEDAKPGLRVVLDFPATTASGRLEQGGEMRNTLRHQPRDLMEGIHYEN
jgi:signal transduction histidine kinase